MKQIKNRCIRSWQGLQDPRSPLPCTPSTQVFADSFSFWALHREKSEAGYIHKRMISRAAMVSIIKLVKPHVE